MEKTLEQRVEMLEFAMNGQQLLNELYSKDIEGLIKIANTHSEAINALSSAISSLKDLAN